MTTTPWGKARVLETARVQQRSGDRRFATVVELVETERGERLVRVAYTTGGQARRGPVTLRTQDLIRLRAALERAPALREALVGEGAVEEPRTGATPLGDVALRPAAEPDRARRR